MCAPVFPFIGSGDGNRRYFRGNTSCGMVKLSAPPLKILMDLHRRRRGMLPVTEQGMSLSCNLRAAGDRAQY